MVNIIRSDRRGLASLIDAILFLLVISALTVSLVQVLPSEAQDGREAAYIHSVHAVMLRTSVFLGEEIGGTNGRTSVPVPLTSAVIGLLGTFGSNDKAGHSQSLEAQIKVILDGFLAPRYDYVWMAAMGESSFSVRNGYYNPDDAHFASTVSTHLPDGAEIEFSLVAWSSSN